MNEAKTGILVPPKQERHEVLNARVGDLYQVERRLSDLKQRIHPTPEATGEDDQPRENSLHSTLVNAPADIQNFINNANELIDQIVEDLF